MVENDVAVLFSFRFRVENAVSFSASVSFAAENAKPGLDWSLAVPNVTVHPSTASVPIAVLLYNGPLLCGFNAPIKG